LAFSLASLETMIGSLQYPEPALQWKMHGRVAPSRYVIHNTGEGSTHALLLEFPMGVVNRYMF
jgi:hypothetical protein